MSSMIRNGNINQTRHAVNQFILPVPLKNETLMAQSSLPQLHNNMNISNSINNPLNINQSSINNTQNNKLQNSEIINRSYQQTRIKGSKLNQSVSLASFGVGSTKNLGKRSFYHHSNIFNLKHYKNLTSHIIDGTDIDDIKNNQKSILIREFRYKVDQYLLFSKYRQEQATKEFNSYYAKVQDQLFSQDGYQSHRLFQNGIGSNGNNAGISFFTMNYEDQNQSLSIIQPEMNKSLLNIDANRFNYSKLSKEEASLIHNINVDIYLENQLGKQKHATHKINHVKLQDFILQKMKSYLSNDTEYDKKIEFVTKEYERILEKIQSRSFKVKIPDSYEPQMQSFNEYYKVDPSKIKQSQIQLTWQDIEANIMNQVLEESKLTDQIEEDKEDENEQIEESYEEIEIEEQKIDDEDSNYYDQENMDNLKNRNLGSAVRTKRQQSQIKQQQKQIQQQGVSQFQERPQVTQVKVVKKKKKKTDKQDTNPEENQDERQNTQSSKSPQNRKKKNDDQEREKSAIEEYIVYRELVPEERPPRQNKQQTTQQPVQQVKKQPPVKKVVQPVVGTPKPKVQQIVPPPPIIQNQSSSSRQQQSTESPRQVNQVVKSSQSSDSEEDVLIFEEAPPQQTNQQEIQKQQTVEIEYEEEKQEEEEVEEEIVEEEQQIEINLPGGNKLNNVEALDMTNSPKTTRSKQVTQQLKKQLSKKPSSQSPKTFNQPSPRQERVPSYSNKAMRKQDSKQPEQIDQVESQSENNDENDLLDDEEYEQKLIKQQSIPQVTIQEPKSETPRQKINKTTKQKVQPPQQDQTPRSVSESPANTPQNQVNRQETEFSYFNDLKIKKKVGTGLIDELVKTNYLLDFNPLSFKKARRLPDLPLDLEFKSKEDKQLFDAIFKWQYEVDLEVNELEEKLQSTQKKRGEDESDEDEDDEDGPHEKSSVHSSDITDFGQPDLNKNSLQNISSGGISDID
ncbi:hypothetical protein ABPG72_006356 [Tetrahymena utriculariae]